MAGLPNAQDLMTLYAVYGGGMGGQGGMGMGGMGMFNPAMFMDPRIAARMQLAQGLMQAGTQGGPTLSRVAPFTRLAQVLAGGGMMQNLMAPQQQDPNAAKAEQAEHEAFAKMLGDPGKSDMRDWFDKLPDWRKTAIELNPPPAVASYIQRQTLNPQQAIVAPGAPPVTAPGGPNELTQAISYYNKMAADPNTPTWSLQAQRSQIAKMITDAGFQPTFDDKGIVSYFPPQGPSSPGYKGQVAGSEAQAQVGPHLQEAGGKPIVAPQGSQITTGNLAGAGGGANAGAAPPTYANPANAPAVTPAPAPVTPTPPIPASPAYAGGSAPPAGGGTTGGGTSPPPPAPPPPTPPPSATGGAPPPPPPPPPSNTAPVVPPLQPQVPQTPQKNVEDLGQLINPVSGASMPGSPGAGMPGGAPPPMAVEPPPMLAPGRGGPPIAPAQTPPIAPAQTPPIAPAAPLAQAGGAVPGEIPGAAIGVGRNFDPNKPLDRSTLVPDPAYAPGLHATPGGGSQVGVNPTQAEALKLPDKTYAENAAAASGAQAMRFNLRAIQNDVDILNNQGKGTGWNTGPVLEARKEIGSYINGVLQVLNPSGTIPRIDMDKIGTVEDFNKLTKNLGLNFGGSVGTGTQKIVEDALSATPNAGMSPQGVKLVLSFLHEQTQMAIDKHNFQYAFQNAPNNPGKINLGSDEEFKRLYPPEHYAMMAVYNTLPPQAVQILAQHSQNGTVPISAGERAYLEKQMGTGMTDFALSQIQQGRFPSVQ